MRVRSLDSRVVQIPLRGHLAMSIGSYVSLDHVMVTLTTSEGIVGRGEATVVPEFLGESVEQVLADMEVLAGALWEIDVGNLAAVHEAMRRERPAARSAYAAVDQACHDALAQERDVPVWRLLGELANASTRYTWIMSVQSAAATEAEAVKQRALGFRTFKLKAGIDADDDVGKVRRLREALGPDVLIRLDANGAYTPEQAFSVLDRLTSYNLEMVEQPCPAGELDAMARLREALGVRVLADESVMSEQDAVRVIESDAADFVNIKVQKLGGLRPALLIARRVAASGLGCILGSCLEVGAGASASAHLAAVCPAVAGDSDLAAGLQNSLPTEWAPIWWDEGCGLQSPTGSGLGLPALRITDPSPC